MSGLTPLGIFHTAISLVALVSGAIALIRDRKIAWDNRVGKTYVITTVIVCLTGFGIFQHGGFGKAHVLGIITLLVLSLALFSGKDSKPFGRFSPYIETVSYSMTFFFHFIPTINESATRLPVGKPLAMGPDDPGIQMAIGICFILFLIGATLQIIKLRKAA